MKTMRIINLDRITSIQIAARRDKFYLVFQDGRRNIAHQVSGLAQAQSALDWIRENNPKWWKVLGDPIEVTFKKSDANAKDSD